LLICAADWVLAGDIGLPIREIKVLFFDLNFDSAFLAIPILVGRYIIASSREFE
jgi:hypothetical protein